MVRCLLLYFSGTFDLTLQGNLQNKELSDDTDGILSMQGVSWINRTAISYGTITLYVKHYKDENGIEHVDSDQTLTGIPGTTELRTLDWSSREHYDYLFGAVVGKSRRRNVGDIEDDYLKGGWLPDTLEHGVIASWIESDTKKSGYSWTSDEVRCVIPNQGLNKHHHYRYGALKKSRGKGATRDTLSSPKNLAVKLSKPVLCMITVSQMPWV